MKRIIAIALVSSIGLMAQGLGVPYQTCVAQTTYPMKVVCTPPLKIRTSKLSKIGHVLKMGAETAGVVVFLGLVVVASGGTNVKIYN